MVQGAPADTEEAKPFVHYQEKMTKTMKDLSRKGQDMVSMQELFPEAQKNTGDKSTARCQQA